MTTPANALRRGYRPDIDGLRAFAVLAVVIYHMNEEWLPGGFVGVDIFFVISGYVVAKSVLRRWRDADCSRCALLSDFYSRRMKRLTPCLTVVTFVTGLAVNLLVPPLYPSKREYLLSGLIALFGGANVYFSVLLSHIEGIESSGNSTTMSKVAGYFVQLDDIQDVNEAHSPHDLIQNPFMHTWSLSVEEQFYLLFPWLAFLAYGSSGKQRGSIRPAWTWAIGIALSLALSLLLAVSDGTNAFYLMPSRFWELAAGTLLVTVEEWYEEQQLSTRSTREHTEGEGVWDALHSSRRYRVMLALVDVCAFGFLIVAIIATRPDGGFFPAPFALLAVLGTLAFIVVGSMPEPRHVQHYNLSITCAPFNTCLSHSMCAYIGRLSYPIYLWHWPLIVFFRWAGLSTWGWMLLSATVSATLSAICYHQLEDPFRKWKPRHNSHVFMLSLSASVLTAGWLVLLHYPLHGKLYTGVPSPPPQPPPSLPPSIPPTPPAPSPTPGAPPLIPQPQTPPQPSAPPEACGEAPPGIYWAQNATAFGELEARSCNCYTCQATSPSATSPEHTPSGSTNAELTPCFVPTPPSAQLELHSGNGLWMRNTCGTLHPLFTCGCTELSATHGGVAKIEACLTPIRQVSLPNAVFLVGDSHASSYVPTVASAFKNRAEVVFATVGNMCGFNSMEFINSTIRTRSQPTRDFLAVRCSEVMAAYWRALRARVRPGDSVLTITAAYKYPRAESFFNFDIAFLREVRSFTESRSAFFIILGDTLWVGPRGDVCARGYSATSNCFFARSEFSDNNPINSGADLALEAFANERPASARFFQAYDLFCSLRSGMCGYTVPGTSTVAIFDHDHWTFEAALYVAPFFACFLDSLGPHLET